MLRMIPERLQTIVCLGSHPDDIEIGCGGTLLRLLKEYPQVVVHWIVLSGDQVRSTEARKSAAGFLGGVAKYEVTLHGFRDRFFPFDGGALKEAIHSVAENVQPDIVFSHRREDYHQDHRCVAEITWNAFRDHTILEYEIPKYEGDLGHPNLYVPLEEDLCRSKIERLLEHFPSQRAKPWFGAETFRAILRLRGLECNSPSGWAEAFYCRKLTI